MIQTAMNVTLVKLSELNAKVIKIEESQVNFHLTFFASKLWGSIPMSLKWGGGGG